MTTNPDYSKCAMQFYCPMPITNARLANAYVPFQRLECTFPAMLGLQRGTIFPELDRPYGADPEFTADA